jgi:hypothetical protein
MRTLKTIRSFRCESLSEPLTGTVLLQGTVGLLDRGFSDVTSVSMRRVVGITSS